MSRDSFYGSCNDEVYGTTEVFMTFDRSPDFVRTWRFLERRLDDVLTLDAHTRGVQDVSATVISGVGSLAMGARSVLSPPVPRAAASGSAEDDPWADLDIDEHTFEEEDSKTTMETAHHSAEAEAKPTDSEKETTRAPSEGEEARATGPDDFLRQGGSGRKVPPTILSGFR